MSAEIKFYDGWQDGGYFGRVTTNSANTLAPILKAIFVDGYNSQAVTSITRTGTTAEITTTGDHGYQTGQVLLVSGCTETEYNGEFRVIVTGARKVQYTISGSPSTPATGSPAVKVASLGWSSPFTPVSPKLVLRNASGSSQWYYRFNDVASMTTTRTPTGGANSLTAQFVCEIKSFETMSDIDTGTETGYMFLKRGAANGGAVANLNVIVVGNDKTALILLQVPGTYVYTIMMLGDYISDIPNEAKPAFLLGQYGSTSQNDGAAGSNAITVATLGIVNGSPSLIFGRNPWGSGTNQTGKLIAPMGTFAVLGAPGQNSNDPNQITSIGSVFPYPVYMQTDFQPVEIRGKLPGVYQTFRGTVNPFGFEVVKNVYCDGSYRSFLLANIHGNASTLWYSVGVDLTGPWT